jgi:hypothetical protein
MNVEIVHVGTLAAKSPKYGLGGGRAEPLGESRRAVAQSKSRIMLRVLGVRPLAALGGQVPVLGGQVPVLGGQVPVLGVLPSGSTRCRSSAARCSC